MINVLVVEDDPVWQKFITDSLPVEQFSSTLTIAIKETLEILKKQSFDLIVLDLMLPDSTAINTLTVMTTAAPYTPIVVSSTIQDPAIQLLALKLGVQDFVVKSHFNQPVLIHAGLSAIQRLYVKVAADINQNVQDILANLNSLENNLKVIEGSEREAVSCQELPNPEIKEPKEP